MPKNSSQSTRSPARRSPARAFKLLRDRWKRDTLVESSMTALVLHRDYQRIIGMGKVALPFLFRELASDPDQWFWALEAITGANPAGDELPFDERVKRWLKWGRDHGYVRPSAR